MERRKFTIGLGALATGSAAAVGTGAFSFLQTDRDLEIEVVDDTGGYLGLNPLKTDYATVDGTTGEVGIEFDELNPNSVTLFDAVVEVKNNGTEDIVFSIPETTSNGFMSTNIVPYVTGTDSGDRQSIWTKDGKTGEFDGLLNDRNDDITNLPDLAATGSTGVEIPVGQTALLGIAVAATEDDGFDDSTGLIMQAASDLEDLEIDAEADVIDNN